MDSARGSSDETVSVKRGETITHTFDNDLKIKNYGWTDKELNFGTPGATGNIENVASERFAQASLAVDFYDEQTQIGTNTSWHYFLDSDEYGELQVPYAGDEPDRITRLQISATVTRDPITPLNQGEVTVTDQGLSQNEDGWPTVKGTVENQTNGRLSRVYPHVNFYNDKELLASAKDGISRLGEDESAEWEVLTDSADYENVNRYEVITQVKAGPKSIDQAIAGDDNEISTSEIQQAIKYWADDQAVPDTDGKKIEIGKLQELIKIWSNDGKI